MYAQYTHSKNLPYDMFSSEDETVENIEELSLPLTSDYQGLGGPESVPLESDGAFEKPPALGNFC